MNDYYQVRFELAPCSEDATDLLAAMLADVEYESFVPDETGVTAFVKAESYSDTEIRAIIEDFPFETQIRFTPELVPGQDWNKEWEKHYFKPIIVGGECVIHSSFHTDIPKVAYDIVIDPKMAFGTGHHATTSLIIGRLLDMPLEGRSVIDMGTGTGILAILAAMRGASPVTGIEIDAFAYANAIENISTNSHPEIRLLNGGAEQLADVAPADVFIANINRNVILGDMAAYAAAVKPGGDVLFSGFYESDIPMVADRARDAGMEMKGKYVAETGWACIHLSKTFS